MTTAHSRYGHPRGRRQIDLASVALLVLGLVFAGVSYVLITQNGANPALLVPSVIAITLGATHLTKHQAPRG